MGKFKKGKIIFVITAIIFLTGVITSMGLFVGNNRGYMPDKGVVPNEETAIRIAEAVWLPIYGDSIYSKQPFVAEYNEKEKCWYVSGTLPENTFGGVPEIKINRMNGEILYISHGK